MKSGTVEKFTRSSYRMKPFSRFNRGSWRASRCRLAVLALLLCVIPVTKPTVKRSRGRLETKAVGEKVISYSLYGDEARYVQGAIENAKLIKYIYPGWTMRIYHDTSVPARVRSTLAELDVDLIDMSNSTINKMSWRFLVASDTRVRLWCSRDIDARLSWRERTCVDAWLATTAEVHIIRDHPSHTQPIPGGTFCGTDRAFPEMAILLRKKRLSHKYGADQHFLKHVVWPRVRTRALQHVSFGCEHFKGSVPIPVRRVGLEHVGSVMIEHKERAGDVSLLEAAIQAGHECVPKDSSFIV